MIGVESQITGPLGHWQVSRLDATNRYFDKRSALIAASKHKDSNVTYHWYDDIWSEFDKSKLGSSSLQHLYRQRAQQLRDEYDYLTLHYSGGADSHNILMTFVQNNIHLDNIFTNWPKIAIDSKIYKPNDIDKSSFNLLSEWDYCVLPTLQWIARYRPEINIEVGDWSANLNDRLYQPESFLKSSTYYGAGCLPRNQNFSKHSQKNLDQGKKVASIYGYDKPRLFLNRDLTTVSMFFSDVSMQTASNYLGEFEAFYWSPKLPQLIFEMAYSILKYYEQNPDLRKYLRSRPLRAPIDQVVEFNNYVARKVLYPDTWNINTFQTEKSFSAVIRDKDFWLYQSPNFDRLISSWRWQFQGFLDEIDDRFRTESGSLVPLNTRLYTIGKFLS
jgi:hypothetical protein